MDFWNDIATKKSWELLKELNKKLDFIVIGGWGIYLWTHALKSKDIDIILADWQDLEKIKKEFEPKKNDRLKKYEIVVSEIDVDIYLPHYSEFPIPCNQLLTMTAIREGFKVIKPEPLVILKQHALFDRGASIKGQKDRVDILSMLSSNIIDFHQYHKLLTDYNLVYLKNELENMIKTTKDEFKYLHITNLRKIKQLKEEWVTKLNKNFK